jgi:class 3 adenylate cyclase
VDIDAWLGGLGLERYAEAFRRNAIGPEALAELTDEDLRELRVLLGHRRVLLKAIRERTTVTPATRASEETLLEEAGAQTPSPATDIVPGGSERRRLTVLFCDLVGSTALTAQLDPEEMGATLRAWQDAISGPIAGFGGHVARFMGDGMLAYFGWPRAHEDDAERAVRAGLAITAATASLRAPNREPLAARVGIATGLVVVGELIGMGSAQEQVVVGETPNLAARLHGKAAPGQVVIAEATRRLVAGGFDLALLGPRGLKGIVQPVEAYVVLAGRKTNNRFEARAEGALHPSFGRDHELALLMERWRLAKAGKGQGMLLIGEAGIGKSRILRALLDTLKDEPHIRLRYQCSPFHAHSAFWPVTQQLAHGDTPDHRLDKLEALLAQAGNEAKADTPLVAALMELDGTMRYGPITLTPPVLRTRMLEGLVRQLLGLAVRRPVALIVEDAHWIDPTTLELLERVLQSVAEAPVLVVLTSRPDNQPDLATRLHVTRLALKRLGREGVEAIVARLGGAKLPKATVAAIVARTDGVPLFVEELTKAVVEGGESTVPATLHDTLMARLDRVSDVKEIAQTAACIGREFDFALLAAIAGWPQAELVAGLERLGAAELVFRRGFGDGARYIFQACASARRSL